jgi:tungstate transport system ATP-binding protein
VLNLPRLSIEEGKIYALLGPNGSGKTTLLMILGFLSSPTSGTLFYNNHPVPFSEKALQVLRREVILVNQHPILFTSTVYKNVEFGLKVRNIDRKERQYLIEEALDMVGMRGFISAQAHHLSGGETQRVAIARALACSPRVILLDEPTASVDVENQIAIENIIRDVRQQRNLSVIVCTHNILQASKLAEEKIFLFDGRPSKSVHENIFSGTVVQREDDFYCVINESLAIPIHSGEKGPVKISINPKSIKIAGQQDGVPAAGFEGKIFQLVAEDKWVRVLIDVGIPLSALLKQNDFDRLGVRIGQRVFVECPDYAVEII